MKSPNRLQFQFLRNATKEEIGGASEDSGNGFYSYNYLVLPFVGVIEAGSLGRISQILHKKHYSYPFTSLAQVDVLKTTPTGGELIYAVTYHHGD